MFEVHDHWVISCRHAAGAAPTLLTVSPPEQVSVEGEAHAALPAGLGASLRSIHDIQKVVVDRLDAASVRIRPSPPASERYERGRDYNLEPRWAVVGRSPEGRIRPDETVHIDYRYGLSRLDTILVDAAGDVHIRQGDSRLSSPRPPALNAGENALANVWIKARLQRLTADSFFPITEDHCPPPPAEQVQRMRQRMPRTMAKLRAGQSVRILAWGDSVTAGGWVPPECRWTQRTLAGLRREWPGVPIDLSASAWGGKSSFDFLDQPAGGEHPYPGTMAGPSPDLIISLFINDARTLTAADAVRRHYERYLADFRRMGTEWLVVTSCYTCPEWMGFAGERQIDADPRPYIVALREFAEASGVALADASRHWGRLWRRGIPYTIHLSNGVNHPDADGMRFISDAVLEVLGRQDRGTGLDKPGLQTGG